MPPLNVQLEDLFDLAETLRSVGFALGTKQYIAAHELLIALAAHGHLPEDPQKWRTLLGPIFCSSRREQEEFGEYFAAWLQQRPALQRAVEAAPPTFIHATKPQATTRRFVFRHWLAATWRTLKRPAVWGSAVALLTLIAAAAAYLNAKTERVLTGKVLSAATQQPLAGATVTFLDTKQQTDAQGEFRFPYQIHNYERFQSDKIEGMLVEHPEHLLETRTVVTKSPERQNITLEKQLPTNSPELVPPPKPPEIPVQPPPPQNNPRLWLAAVPLLLYAFWLLWRWWRRRLILQKLQIAGTPRLQQLKLARNGVKLFDVPAFRRAVVELRRHRHVEANDLDVAATVRATIRRGGFFTPSFGRRRTLPEYLLLIDRASLQDEQARVGEALAEQLKAGEIGIEWLYFQGDARTCRYPEPFAPTVTLNELAARYPDHRLLIFGDGAGFFNPFSGEPQHWLSQFEQWTERAVITPATPDSWGYREEVLQEHDFLLLPASAAGFEVLSAWLNAGVRTEPRSNPSPPFPALVLERPKRWLGRLAPQPKLTTQLIEQLQHYLDEEGWLWLRACAVYPQVTWELTMYLGARLLDPSPNTDWAERVLHLVRLPWFRYGTMPDWLRSELIAQFTPEQEMRVRGVLEDLLYHVMTKLGEAIPIEVATLPEAEPRGWRKMLAPVRQWWQRRKLYRMLRAQPEDSLLRDYVFLSFLVGQRPKRLAVQAPKLWQRLLFTDGSWALGLRPVTMGILALLASGALLGLFVLTGKKIEPVPLAKISPTPSPTASIITPTPSATSTRKTSVTPKPNLAPSGTPVNPPILRVGKPIKRVPGGYSIEITEGVVLEIRAMPPGNKQPTFRMGSDEGEGNEKPAHQVTLNPFFIGKYEVTQAQWQAVMGNNPSYFQGDDLPVERVSWNDAVEFCRRLSEKTGLQFRLPTEAEWEYAARAGTTTEYSFGNDVKQLDAYAWHSYSILAHPVGKKLPNRFGLYDMYGNVWEWCQDWYGEYSSDSQVNPMGPGIGGYRVQRGGSRKSGGEDCRSARRHYGAPSSYGDDVGFRVVVAARTP